MEWLQQIFTVMSSAGSIVFDNLALILAIGVAVGLARVDKGTAGLVAGLAYLVMNASINAMRSNTGQLAENQLASAGQGMVLGIQTLQTGVVGEIIVGLNRSNKCREVGLRSYFSYDSRVYRRDIPHEMV